MIGIYGLGYDYNRDAQLAIVFATEIIAGQEAIILSGIDQWLYRIISYQTRFINESKGPNHTYNVFAKSNSMATSGLTAEIGRVPVLFTVYGRS